MEFNKKIEAAVHVIYKYPRYYRVLTVFSESANQFSSHEKIDKYCLFFTHFSYVLPKLFSYIFAQSHKRQFFEMTAQKACAREPLVDGSHLFKKSNIF